MSVGTRFKPNCVRYRARPSANCCRSRPVLRACVLQYHREHPDHDRLWLKEHHRELYQRIVAQENAIDALGTVQLSKLMEHLKEWRSMMLQAEFATADDVRELFGGKVMTTEEYETRARVRRWSIARCSNGAFYRMRRRRGLRVSEYRRS